MQRISNVGCALIAYQLFRKQRCQCAVNEKSTTVSVKDGEVGKVQHGALWTIVRAVGEKAFVQVILGVVGEQQLPK